MAITLGVLVTLGVLAVFIVIGLIPQIPFPAKLGLQLVLALVIYFGPPSEHYFELGEQMFKGGQAVTGKFNFLSMALIAFVLGVVSSVVGIIPARLLAKKADG